MAEPPGSGAAAGGALSRGAPGAALPVRGAKVGGRARHLPCLAPAAWGRGGAARWPRVTPEAPSSRAASLCRVSFSWVCFFWVCSSNSVLGVGGNGRLGTCGSRVCAGSSGRLQRGAASVLPRHSLAGNSSCWRVMESVCPS